MEMTFLRNATCCLPFDVSTQSVTNIYAHFIIIMCFVIIYSYVLILLICWALHLPEVVPIYFKKYHDLWPCLFCDCENFMKLLPWCVVVWLKMTSRGSLGMHSSSEVWPCWIRCGLVGESASLKWGGAGFEAWEAQVRPSVIISCYCLLIQMYNSVPSPASCLPVCRLASCRDDNGLNPWTVCQPQLRFLS